MPVERSFDSIVVGEESSVERMIRAEDIEVFRGLSGGDRSPIHTDVAYAQAHGFKDRLAYGAMLGALLSELIGMQLPGRNSMCVTQSFEFKKPFYAGDTLKLTGIVSSKSAATQLVELSITVTRGGEAIAAGSARVRMLGSL